MKHMSQNSQTTATRRSLWVGVIALLIVAASVFIYLQFFHGANEAKTTSTSKTAQSDYSDGKERPTDGQSAGNSQGGATDNNGDDSEAPTDSGSVTSDDKAITVIGLTPEASLGNGDILRGTAASGVTQVQFRVIDDEVGVIAQGRLNVVNGAFSGKLSFTSKTSTGRVDVFNFDNTGMETSNIEIPVQFK